MTLKLQTKSAKGGDSQLEGLSGNVHRKCAPPLCWHVRITDLLKQLSDEDTLNPVRFCQLESLSAVMSVIQTPDLRSVVWFPRRDTLVSIDNQYLVVVWAAGRKFLMERWRLFSPIRIARLAPGLLPGYVTHQICAVVFLGPQTLHCDVRDFFKLLFFASGTFSQM